MSYPAGGNFLRLDCGVKQWVYTSAATKLCCTVALLCGAVLLCYCSSPLLELQHELLHHGLHCGVKQWVYTSVALLCGAVLLCYCSSPVLELQHELLHHGVDPRGDTAGMCATGVVLGMQCAIAAGQYPVRVTSFLHSRRRAGPAGPQSA